MLTETDARYVPSLHALVLILSNSTRRLFPPEQLERLQDAPKSNVKNVEVVGSGSGLHWPDLDVDLSVEGLTHGIHGTKEWMSNLGCVSGSVTSKAKAEAARANGLKGGRPKMEAGVHQSTRGCETKKAAKGSKIRTTKRK